MRTNGEGNSAVRDLEALFVVGATGGLADGVLLDRFVARREGAVFEAIVRRHGPMVWGVCRRVVGDHHDAEDSFQATFQVLARKAASVRPPEKLAAWLHGVAYRTAMKARGNRARRLGREHLVGDLSAAQATETGPADDLLARLDREVGRLPEKYRVPILLCELEGKSHREAAEALGWPVGTVSGRLSRGRALLARRMGQSVLAVGGLLATNDAAWSGPSARLVEATALAAASHAGTAGLVSVGVANLTREVLMMMKLTKVAGSVAMLAGMALAAGGVGLAYRALADEPVKVAAPPDPSVKPAPAPAGVEQVVVDAIEEPPPAVPPSPPHVDLPGSQQHFGGEPGEPSYFRNGNLFFVVSPAKDKFSIYDAWTKRAVTLRLPIAEGSPTSVVPIVGEHLISLSIQGARVNRIHVFSPKDWKWYGQDLQGLASEGPGLATHPQRPEVVTGNSGVDLGSSVAAWSDGRHVHGFSTRARQWSVLELPKGFTAHPRIERNRVVVESEGQVYEFSGDSGKWKHTDLESEGQVYEFSGDSGKWKHTDLRAVIDSAINASGEVVR